MASFPNDRFAKAFGKDMKAAVSPLDGLVSIAYEKTDRDFNIDSDGGKYIPRGIRLYADYQPPGNKATLDFYGNADNYIVIEREIPDGEGKGITRYLVSLLQVKHVRLASGQDSYQIIGRTVDPPTS